MLPLVEEPVSASLTNLCLVGFFVGGRELFLTWADERTGNLRDGGGMSRS